MDKRVPWLPPPCAKDELPPWLAFCSVPNPQNCHAAPSSIVAAVAQRMRRMRLSVRSWLNAWLWYLRSSASRSSGHAKTAGSRRLAQDRSASPARATATLTRRPGGHQRRPRSTDCGDDKHGRRAGWPAPGRRGDWWVGAAPRPSRVICCTAGHVELKLYSWASDSGTSLYGSCRTSPTNSASNPAMALSCTALVTMSRRVATSSPPNRASAE
jgi:hypothetical protein